MIIRRILIACLAGAAVVIGGGRNGLADLITIGAAKDNTLYEEGGLSNGVGEHFFAGLTGGLSNPDQIRRGLIAFDIAGSIAAGSTINSVTLTLNMSQTQSGNTTVELHTVSQDWGQGTSSAGGGGGGGAPATIGDATWIHAFFNTSAWSTAGGDFNPTVSATQTVGAVGSYTWASTSQTVADVQSWLDSPAGNFGWLVLGDETQRPKRFDTRENPLAGNRPQLTIEFQQVPEPTSIALFAVGGLLYLVGRGWRRLKMAA